MVVKIKLSSCSIYEIQKKVYILLEKCLDIKNREYLNENSIQVF